MQTNQISIISSAQEMPFEQSDWCAISQKMVEMPYMVTVYCYGWNFQYCSAGKCQTCFYYYPIQLLPIWAVHDIPPCFRHCPIDTEINTNGTTRSFIYTTQRCGGQWWAVHDLHNICWYIICLCTVHYLTDVMDQQQACTLSVTE